MRTIEEIERDFKATKKDDKLIETSKNCYEMKNAEKRKQLREEYVNMLPQNQQLAIWLHSKLCQCSHTDMCFFYYEIDDLKDNWTKHAHKKYLNKADKLLAITDDINMIHDMIEAIVS